MRRVVITGLGAVTPMGPDCSSLWQGLRDGGSAVEKISYFDVENYPCQIAAQSLAIPFSDWGENQGRVARMARAAAEQAWLDSGISEEKGAGLGLSMGWEEQEFSGREESFNQSALPLDHSIKDFRQRFGLHGPLLTCYSACAAGTQLVEEATRSIRTGETDIFLAGASDSRIHPLGLWGYARLGALAANFNQKPKLGSRPFDRQRSGFVMGEGAGFVVLEERGQALRRGAHVYAEILGAASTCDAYSLTAPRENGAVAARSISSCLERAGLRAEDIDYINAHGTSTPANDAAEVKALELALGAGAGKIPLGSFKSMIGHLAMASGLVEIIGTVLAMKHGVIPPNLNLDEPAFALNFAGLSARELPLRNVLKTSFGFGGQNSSILLASPKA